VSVSEIWPFLHILLSRRVIASRSYENHSPSTTQTGNGPTTHSDHGGPERNGPDQLLGGGKHDQIDVSTDEKQKIKQSSFSLLLMALPSLFFLPICSLKEETQQQQEQLHNSQKLSWNILALANRIQNDNEEAKDFEEQIMKAQLKSNQVGKWFYVSIKIVQLFRFSLFLFCSAWG
jgi:hypothetical protein